MLARMLPILAAIALAGCGAGGPPVTEDGPRIEARFEREWVPDPSPARQPVFSRDGRWLATSSASGRIVVRDTRTWATAADLLHPGGATALAFGADAARLYSAGYDGVVRIWDLATRRETGRFSGAQGTVWSLDLSPDGRRLAAAGEDQIIRIWPLDRPGRVLLLRGHERNIWEVRFSPDGNRLASGSFDMTVRLWDANSGAALRTLTGHSQAVVGLTYSPDGRTIATAGDDSTIRFWRAEDGAPLRTIDNGNHVYDLAFSPDGRWLASAGRARGGIGTFWHQLSGGGGEGAPVRLWRVADGALLQTIAHPEDVLNIAFSPDGRSLVTAAEDGHVRLWAIAGR